MCNIYKKIKLLIACAMISGFAFAYEGDLADLYQVDIIVFEHTDSKRFDAEIWPKVVGKLDASNAIKLSSLKGGAPESLDILESLDALDEVGDKPIKSVVPETINLVETKNMRMQEEARVIKAGKVSRLIVQTAWIQPLANYVRSTPVFMQGGKDNQEVQAVIDIKPQARNQFNVSFDLLFNTDTNNRQGIKEFRVTRDIKLKSKEIYYFDHPVIGAMILITPMVVDQ
jgi:hypothetical protein